MRVGDLADTWQSVENIWPDKVDYSLSTPTKAVIFGTNVHVDFKLIPLLKGLRFGKIVTELNEKQEVSIKGPRAPIRSRVVTRSIAKDDYRLPEDVESENVEGQDGYTFSRSIRIPQSLTKCLQTVDALGIKIRHNISFNVQMHNPDGHVSEVSEPKIGEEILLTCTSCTPPFLYVSSFLRTCLSTIITI